jgi:RND superfamily putative drug exporter
VGEPAATSCPSSHSWGLSHGRDCTLVLHAPDPGSDRHGRRHRRVPRRAGRTAGRRAAGRRARLAAATGGVITSAGVVPAATFSTLALAPFVAFVEIGVTVAFGVLLDTALVRSVLVPALALDVGRRLWWPSRLVHAAPRDPDEDSLPARPVALTGAPEAGR